MKIMFRAGMDKIIVKNEAVVRKLIFVRKRLTIKDK